MAIAFILAHDTQSMIEFHSQCTLKQVPLSLTCSLYISPINQSPSQALIISHSVLSLGVVRSTWMEVHTKLSRQKYKSPCWLNVSVCALYKGPPWGWGNCDK